MNRLNNIRQSLLGLCIVLAIIVGYAGLGTAQFANAAENVIVDGVVVDLPNTNFSSYADIEQYVYGGEAKGIVFDFDVLTHKITYVGTNFLPFL